MSFFNKDKNKKEDKSMNPAKPITQDDDFCAALAEGKMDFSNIRTDKDGNERQFIVAVSTGGKNKPTLLASTMRGPFDFFEMVESVGCMWEREQHHARVYMLTKSFDEASTFLDDGTIDYIETNWESILAEGIFEASLFDDDLPVFSAGIIEANPKDDE